MPVQRVNQFLEFVDFGITPSLGIESEKLIACIAEAKYRKWRGVFGCPLFGFKESDLNFLSELPFIEQVWFWDVALKSIDGLYALTNLKYFGIHPQRPGIDFSKFPELEIMVWIHNQKDTQVNRLKKLKSINIWHFKPRSKSFADLALPPSIESLELFWANPDSLSGITPLPNLRKLEIHRCRNLSNLESLAEIAPSLESLVVTTSGKVEPSSIPLNIKSLKYVIANGRQLKG